MYGRGQLSLRGASHSELRLEREASEVCGSQRGWGIKQDPPHTHTHTTFRARHCLRRCSATGPLRTARVSWKGSRGSGQDVGTRPRAHTHTHTQLLPWGRQGRAGLPPSCKQPRGGSRTARPAHSPDNPHHQMLLGDFSSSRGCLRRLPTLLLVFPARASPLTAPRRGSGRRLLGPLQAPAHPQGSGNPPEDAGLGVSLKPCALNPQDWVLSAPPQPSSPRIEIWGAFRALLGLHRHLHADKAHPAPSLATEGAKTSPWV